MNIFAHRGCAFDYQENTIDAFERSILNGFKHIECDVRFNHEGHAYVFHDANLKRLFGIDLNFYRLKDVDIKALNNRHPNKAIASKLDLLHIIEKYPNCYWNIEFKNDDGSCKKAYLKFFLNNFKNFKQRLVFSCFDFSLIKDLSLNYSDHAFALLLDDKEELKKCVKIFDTEYKNIEALHVSEKFCKQVFFEESALATNEKNWLSRYSKKVFTVNNFESLKHYEKLGIDGVFTDKSEFLR